MAAARVLSKDDRVDRLTRLLSLRCGDRAIVRAPARSGLDLTPSLGQTSPSCGPPAGGTARPGTERPGGRPGPRLREREALVARVAQAEEAALLTGTRHGPPGP